MNKNLNKNCTNAVEAISRLIEVRKWEKFHVPHYLVPALQVECSELMDCCLWHSSDEIDKMFAEKNPAVVSELADVAINLLSILEFCDLDINTIVLEKTTELLDRYNNLVPGTHK